MSHTLRLLNHEARRQLRRIKRIDLTPTQYREAGDSFGALATRMIGALRFHHEILQMEAEPQTFRFKVVFVGPCGHRSEKTQLPGHGDEAECEVLNLEPAHRAEIVSLLELTSSIEDSITRRSTLRGATLNALFGGLNRFRLAVVKQGKQLLATSPQPMRFELETHDSRRNSATLWI